jgi:hypothetical protein
METLRRNMICHELPKLVPSKNLPYPRNIHREVNHELHLLDGIDFHISIVNYENIWIPF